MRVFYLNDRYNNLGDNLNRPILEWLGHKVDYAPINESGKFVGVGSVITVVRPGDTVWGSGIIRPNANLSFATRARYLAVRGRITRDMLIRAGAEVPAVYGDPALLLPLMYQPKNINPIYEVGYIRHYIDRDVALPRGAFDINIQTLDYRHFIDQIMLCKKIVSSTLHGLIIAEAYGKQVEWVKYSERIVGGEFKFHDYLTGTGREPQTYGIWPELDRQLLAEIQGGLIHAINCGLK